KSALPAIAPVLLLTVALVDGLLLAGKVPILVCTPDSARGTMKYGTRSVTFALSEVVLGVSTISPAAWRKEIPAPFSSPAVPTGTVRVTWTWAVLLAGTVIVVGLMTIECGRLTDAGAELTLNLASVDPLFLSAMVFVLLKLFCSS